MRVWVTRPEEDGEAFARALAARGIGTVVAPLLRIVYSAGPPLDATGVQAILATSANGIRAFALRCERRDLTVYAVGDASAAAARSLGFDRVESAAGDVEALAGLVRRRLDPDGGALLHAAAGALAGDLGGALRAAGFDYRREVLYEAVTADALPEAVADDLARGRLDGVAVFSPRTGRTLDRLIRAAGLTAATGGTACFCLSEAVAATVSDLPWSRLEVAREPTAAALAARIAAVAGAHSRVDSFSASEYYPDTLDAAKARRGGDGGMTSDTGKDRDSATGSDATDVPPTVAAGPADATTPGDAPRTDDARPGPWADAVGSSADEAVAGRRGGAAIYDREPSGEDTAPELPAGADAPVSHSTDAPDEPARGGGRGKLIAAAAIAALLIGGGAAAWFGWVQPSMQATPTAEDAAVDPLADLGAGLEGLEARQSRLRQQLEAMAPRLDTLEKSVEALRQSIDALAVSEQEVPGASPQELADRIARLEGQAAMATSLAQQVRALEVSTEAARDTAAKLASTVLAVGQLSQAVGAGGPFVRPLAAVRALGGDDPDIAQAVVDLQPLAPTGIPSLAALRLRFPQVAEAVVRATPATTGEGWGDRVVDRLSSLVTIRRTGADAIAEGGVDGILAQAETALAGGDLQAAVTALQRLQGPSAEPAADWLAQAESRLTAERALATLQQRAIARLAPAKG